MSGCRVRITEVLLAFPSWSQDSGTALSIKSNLTTSQMQRNWLVAKEPIPLAALSSGQKESPATSFNLLASSRPQVQFKPMTDNREQDCQDWLRSIMIHPLGLSPVLPQQKWDSLNKEKGENGSWVGIQKELLQGPRTKEPNDGEQKVVKAETGLLVSDY